MNLSEKLALAGTLLLSAAASAAEPVVDATDPAQLVEIIRDLGYRARLETDNVGDPKISTSVGGTDTTILFFGCSDNQDCTMLLFKVGYDLTDGTTLSAVNGWNADKLFGRAYLDDEDDPWLEMPVNLFAGVTRTNFEDTFDWWEVIVEDFEDYIDF